MKKTIVSVVVLASLPFYGMTGPYIGIEYGVGSTNHDEQNKFMSSSSNVKLDPSNEDGILSGFLGYSLNQRWAFELGYSQFELDDDYSKFVRYDPATYTITEEEWDANVKAKQFSLVSVYSHSLNNRWLAKLKAGLTYSQYDISSAHYIEKENQLSDIEMITPISSESSSSSEIGGILSVGMEYLVYSQFYLGANAKYQFDSWAKTASFNLGSTYYF
ncbi:AcfA family outer membrane beta-barrel protein [Vibrio lentus]|uniref:AcfA family outer membrane beta-barrel protein n=1 Tax=Vibrio lentus TaxID=136468 RepID=UPI000C84CCBE|nr:AcfA family outer membrane beta-barrel protein [Vibrio lentus]PMH03886.1 organic solvent ABC transporter substrate-binding protein [Vibrio lentus]